jgi:hypothetical protein
MGHLVQPGNHPFYNYFAAVARRHDGELQARRLEDGFPEWRETGLPVEKTTADGARLR